jgi:AraC-like DNA-binding protein
MTTRTREDDALGDWLSPIMHPTYARMLCARLRQAGVDEQAILEGLWPNWASLLETQQLISMDQMARLVRRAIQLTGKPWIGLEVGTMTLVSAHGPVGNAVIAARDARQAMQVLGRFGGLRMRGMEIRFDEQRGYGSLVVSLGVDLRDITEYVFSTFSATLIRMLEITIGQYPAGIHVHYPFARPAWAQIYQQYLGAEVHFGAPELRVDIPREVLDQRCLTADPAAHAQAERECAHQLTLGLDGGALASRVRERLLARRGRMPTLEVMAAEMAMSRRSLIRHLKAEGTSYQQLLDDVRRELGAWYLRNTQTQVEAIAEKLGYQSASNFSRSFRRWFDMTPREMRMRANVPALPATTRDAM